jgi:hypothetical protein
MDRLCGSVIADTLNGQMMGKFVSLAGLIQAWLFIEFAEHAPVPSRFRKKGKWIPAEQRGKVIEFAA